MLKKLSIIALAGLTIFLSGCSVTSISDEQYSQQTATLNQMQLEMATLLSGMNALQAQNDKLNEVLGNVQDYIDQETKINTTLQHGSAYLSDTGMDITFDFSGDTTPVTGIDIPSPSSLQASGSISTGALPADPHTNSGTVEGSGLSTPHKQNTGAFLDELRKASANAKSGSQDHGTGTTASVTAGTTTSTTSNTTTSTVKVSAGASGSLSK